MNVKVTVVIVNWNGGAYLGRCLAALQAQTETAFRAVVIDNGSSDGSAEAVAAFDDPRFMLQALGENRGFAAANNLAVREHAVGEWVALLNPDAFPAPDWLECLLAAAAAHPQYAFFGARLVDAANSRRLDGTGDVYHVSGLAWRRGHSRAATTADLTPLEIFGPCAAAALYRLDAWREVGGFDEDYFCYFEDVDLAFRLRLAGYRCRYVPEAVCRHVGSGLTGRRSDFSVYHGHRNLVWTFVKDMPAPLLWLLAPLHLAQNVLALAAFALRGQGRCIWCAKRDALAGLPVIWAKRRALQARRRIGARELWRVLDKRLWPWSAVGVRPSAP